MLQLVFIRMKMSSDGALSRCFTAGLNLPNAVSVYATLIDAKLSSVGSVYTLWRDGLKKVEYFGVHDVNVASADRIMWTESVGRGIVVAEKQLDCTHVSISSKYSNSLFSGSDGVLVPLKLTHGNTESVSWNSAALLGPRISDSGSVSEEKIHVRLLFYLFYLQ